MSNMLLKVLVAVAVGLVGVSSLAGPAHAQPGSSSCDAYTNASAWCEPKVPDYDCDDIAIELRPIQLVNPANDPFRLDADNDSIGCELTGTSPGETSDDDAAGDLDQGRLPETGSASLVLGGLGAGGLLLGLLLLVIGRRRITSTTS